MIIQIMKNQATVTGLKITTFFICKQTLTHLAKRAFEILSKHSDSHCSDSL